MHVHCTCTCINMLMNTRKQKKDTWHLHSDPGIITNGYTITKVIESCEEDFTSVCTKSECQFLCWHMYTCDDACYDYNNVCTYMYNGIHSTLPQPQVTQTSVTPHDVDIMKENTVMVHKTSDGTGRVKV